MPRENSFSDEDGRSLTPDLELPEPQSPEHVGQTPPVIAVEPSGQHATLPAPAAAAAAAFSVKSPVRPTFANTVRPIDRFRATVNKVIRLHRTSTIISDRGGIGAEPGVDPRRDSAYLTYGHIRQNWRVSKFASNMSAEMLIHPSAVSSKWQIIPVSGAVSAE
jgi:hypothetical protein